jgi:CubicO group peptidase (beta-lactamase class C family)
VTHPTADDVFLVLYDSISRHQKTQQMNVSRCSILYLSLLLVAACGSEKVPDTKTSVKVLSEEYAQPSFADSSRASRVRPFASVVESIFQKYAQENHIPGLAYGIVVGDELVIHNGWGFASLESNIPATIQTNFRIASMSKSFTALAILKLRDQGKLQLTDPVAKHLPAFHKLRYPTSDSPLITIENLLTMSAGFPEDNPWGDRQLADSDDELLRLLETGLSFSNAPGIEYEYSNLGFASLGKIISVVSGQPYQQYIRDQILQPLGMTEARWEYQEIAPEKLALGYRWEDNQWKKEALLSDGAYGAMGGLICSVEDFSKYIAFHMQAWPPRNENESSIALRSSLREMHQLQKIGSVSDQYMNKPCAVVAGYGYGLGYRKDCRNITTLRHGGGLPGFGSEWRFYQEYGIGIVSLSNRTYAGLGATNASVLDTLLKLADLKPLNLPVSKILSQRQQEIVKVIQSWEPNDQTIFAENFFLDRSLDHWKTDTKKFWEEAGTIQKVKTLRPENQLRGTFVIECEKKNLNVFFTLTPEQEPLVQQLDIWVTPKP